MSLSHSRSRNTVTTFERALKALRLFPCVLHLSLLAPRDEEHFKEMGLTDRQKKKARPSVVVWAIITCYSFSPSPAPFFLFFSLSVFLSFVFFFPCFLSCSIKRTIAFSFASHSPGLADPSPPFFPLVLSLLHIFMFHLLPLPPTPGSKKGSVAPIDATTPSLLCCPSIYLDVQLFVVVLQLCKKQKTRNLKTFMVLR